MRRTGLSLCIAIAVFLAGCTLLTSSPTASFDVEPVVLYAGDPVVFDGSSSSGSSPIASYDWNLGNGDITSGARVTTTYSNAGTYAVSLVVTDADGRTSSVTQDVTVYVRSGTILLDEDFADGAKALSHWPLDPTWASAGDATVEYISGTVGYALHIRSGIDRWHRRYAPVSIPPLRTGQQLVFTCRFMAGQTQDEYTFLIVPMRHDVATSAGSLPYYLFTSDGSYVREAPAVGVDVGHPIAFRPNTYRWHTLTFDYSPTAGYTLAIDDVVYQSGPIGEPFADGGDWFILLGEESFTAACNVYYDDIVLRVDE